MEGKAEKMPFNQQEAAWRIGSNAIWELKSGGWIYGTLCFYTINKSYPNVSSFITAQSSAFSLYLGLGKGWNSAQIDLELEK